MNIFDKLGNIYTELDNIYANKEVTAFSKGHFKKEADYLSKRLYNDQAYFLYMFSRLEDRVRSLSDKLIDVKMTSLTDWKLKRSWDIILKQKNNDSLHFMNRVSLLTEKGGSNYNLIKRYYNQRNIIGHGKNFTITISIQTVIIDMKRLHISLK